MKQGTLTQSTTMPQSLEMKHLFGEVYEFTRAENIVEKQVVDTSGETSPEQTQYEYTLYIDRQRAENYDAAVNLLIGLKYSTGDEISIARKGIDNREDSEYTAYLNYVNECKTYAREFFGIEQTAEEIAKENAEKYIPAAYTSMVALAKTLLASSPVQDDDEKITLSGLYEEWSLGNYSVGDIRNYGGQTWECFQAHDNATYPDINPENESTWRTFWRPLHGKTIETARPFTPVTNATDTYKAGEYMIFTDGQIYKCLSETAYSPTEYTAAWEVVDDE